MYLATNDDTTLSGFLALQHGCIFKRQTNIKSYLRVNTRY